MREVRDIQADYTQALNEGYRAQWCSPNCFMAWKPMGKMVSFPDWLGIDEEWLEKESEVDDCIERGEFEEFNSMDEFIASLELDEK